MDTITFLWIVVGGGFGVGVGVWLAAMAGFIAEYYEAWQEGRNIGLVVTEKNHQRRLELLAKLIELWTVEAGDANQRVMAAKDEQTLDVVEENSCGGIE